MPSETIDDLDSAGLHELHAFVLGLGRSLAQAGAAVNETQERLRAVAAASGAREARVIVLPTALIIAFGRAGSATCSLWTSSAPGRSITVSITAPFNSMTRSSPPGEP
jgi:uncharacterized membrane protein YjjP (DUF1212 family)